MSDDRITELAKQAGSLISTPFYLWCQHFAELVRNDALEEAAKVCETPDCIPNSTFDGMAAHIRSMKT